MVDRISNYQILLYNKQNKIKKIFKKHTIQEKQKKSLSKSTRKHLLPTEIIKKLELNFLNQF